MTRRLAVLALAAALSAGSPAHARGRAGLEAYGGLSRHAMGDMNDTLRSFNREFGTSLDPIHGGPSWGVALRMWPNENLLLRLGYEGLNAQSEDTGVRFDVGAQAVTLGATYFFPTTRIVRYGVGLAFGPYFVHGRLAASRSFLATSGKGFGGRVVGEAILPLRGPCSLNGMLGYRWGSVRRLKFGEATSDIEADYSGVLVRVALAVDGER